MVDEMGFEESSPSQDQPVTAKSARQNRRNARIAIDWHAYGTRNETGQFAVEPLGCVCRSGVAAV
jgi:hypothetical protein